jgi:hypothetical protein
MSNLWWFRSNIRQKNQAFSEGMILEGQSVYKTPAGVVDGMQLKVSNKDELCGNSIPEI